MFEYMQAERAFVANALIRQCFEMGNPRSSVLSVDPEAESTTKRRLRIAVLAGLYMVKVAALSILLKMALLAALPRQAYAWLNSYILLC